MSFKPVVWMDFPRDVRNGRVLLFSGRGCPLPAGLFWMSMYESMNASFVGSLHFTQSCPSPFTCMATGPCMWQSQGLRFHRKSVDPADSKKSRAVACRFFCKAQRAHQSEAPCFVPGYQLQEYKHCSLCVLQEYIRTIKTLSMQLLVFLVKLRSRRTINFFITANVILP